MDGRQDKFVWNSLASMKTSQTLACRTNLHMQSPEQKRQMPLHIAIEHLNAQQDRGD
jgi:PhoPQ-activated pathogenicity-related protein